MDNNNQINENILYSQYLELNELENEKVINSLQKLKNIETTISTKDNLIKHINQNTNKQIHTIKNIIFIIIILILNIFILKFYFKYKIILIILWSILILYFLYDYNIFYFKDLFNINKIEDILDESIDNTYNNLDKYFGNDNDTNSDYTNWVDSNCDCETGDEQNYNYDTTNNINSESSELVPGLFYYDGTSPKQLINPLPTNKNSDQIYYPDFDENKFNKNSKLVNSNTFTSNL